MGFLFMFKYIRLCVVCWREVIFLERVIINLNYELFDYFYKIRVNSGYGNGYDILYSNDYVMILGIFYF